jgi:biotin carboxylase
MMTVPSGPENSDSAQLPVVLVFSSRSYRVEAFLEAAGKLGAPVLLASDFEGGSARLLGDRFVRVDLDDPERAAFDIVSAVGTKKVAAVVALDDAGVLTAGTAASKLGLSRNSIAGLRATRDKAALRARLSAGELLQPRWYRVDRGPDLQHLRKIEEVCGFPCVVKPVSLQASVGVVLASSPADLFEAVEVASSVQRDETGRAWPVLVEEYLPGREVAVEGILVEGELETAVHIDKPEAPRGPYFEETMLVMPTDLDESTERRLVEMVEEACRLLGIVEGPVHAEFREGSQGFCLLELAARTIGGLCSRAIRFETAAGSSESRTLEEAVLERAIGRFDQVKCTGGYSGVVMLYPQSRGILRKVEGVGEAAKVAGVTDVEITIAPGSEVQPLPRSGRYLGFVFARAERRSECIDALQRARNLIRPVIEEIPEGEQAGEKPTAAVTPSGS